MDKGLLVWEMNGANGFVFEPPSEKFVPCFETQIVGARFRKVVGLLKVQMTEMCLEHSDRNRAEPTPFSGMKNSIRVQIGVTKEVSPQIQQSFEHLVKSREAEEVISCRSVGQQVDEEIEGHADGCTDGVP